MLLRIEDLDRDRCRPGFADGLRHDLEWLGLGWDAEVPAQSTRDAAYGAAIARLRADGRVFECFCTRRELREASAPHGASDETPRCAAVAAIWTSRAGTRSGPRGGRRRCGSRHPPRIRRWSTGSPARSPRASAAEIVVRRSDGLYAYHLAVVVDDAADGVTDVVPGRRPAGSATDPQTGLQALLGLPRPAYAHVPLVLGPDGARLSKRHGAVSIADLRDAGVGPGEIAALLARSAGVAASGAVTSAELVAGFALEQIDRRPATLPGLVPGG